MHFRPGNNALAGSAGNSIKVAQKVADDHQTRRAMRQSQRWRKLYDPFRLDSA